MEPHETYLEAALVHSEAEAAVRQQVVEAIRTVVHEELTRLVQAAVAGAQGLAYPNAANPFDTISNTMIARHEYDIKRMALRAVKEHFQNPQQIY